MKGSTGQREKLGFGFKIPESTNPEGEGLLPAFRRRRKKNKTVPIKINTTTSPPTTPPTVAPMVFGFGVGDVDSESRAVVVVVDEISEDDERGPVVVVVDDKLEEDVGDPVASFSLGAGTDRAEVNCAKEGFGIGE